MAESNTPRTNRVWLELQTATEFQRAVEMQKLAEVLEFDLGCVTAELDRYKRISESGESLGGELEERERRMELEAANEALRKAADAHIEAMQREFGAVFWESDRPDEVDKTIARLIAAIKEES